MVKKRGSVTVSNKKQEELYREDGMRDVLGHRLNLWSGNEDPACCLPQPILFLFFFIFKNKEEDAMRASLWMIECF